MARKGEKIITQTEMEARLRTLNNKIDGVLSYLVFIGGAGVKNFLIQGKRQTITGGVNTAVTFDVAYKTGTVPIVIGTSENYNCYFGLNGAPTATGFNARSRLHDGTSTDSTCDWIAIGERG